jgi:hypothetical protein
MVAKIGCARQRASVESVRIAGGGGQPHDDAGPTGAAVDLDLAPMPLEQPLGHREAESCAELAGPIREEGIEDPFAHVVRDTQARVLDALHRVARAAEDGPNLALRLGPTAQVELLLGFTLMPEEAISEGVARLAAVVDEMRASEALAPAMCS